MLVKVPKELLLEYTLKIDFRNVGWMAINHVVLFFASTDGMLGVAANVVRGWSVLDPGAEVEETTRGQYYKSYPGSPEGIF